MSVICMNVYVKEKIDAKRELPSLNLLKNFTEQALLPNSSCFLHEWQIRNQTFEKRCFILAALGICGIAISEL
jgi:hypothetical protein